MTQSFTKFYTEFHGVFLMWIVLKRDTQRRFTFLDWNADDTDLTDEHGFFNLKELK